MTIDISPDLRAEISNHRRQNNVDIDYGYLNGPDNEPRVRDGSGRMWVSIQNAEGYTKPVALPVDTNANINPKNNVSVEIGYHNGEQTILKASRRGLIAAGVNPNITNPLDPDVKGTVQTADISQFRCKRSVDVSKPWTVIVESGYLEIDGVAYVFIESELDLSGLVPAAGEKVAACVYVRTDLTLEAFASAPVLPEDPISSGMIDECRQQAAIDSMSDWLWVLEGDLSGLTEDPNKNMDLRPIYEPPVTSAGGSDPTAIHTDAAGEIAGLTQKASPVSADKLLIEDSADSDNKKYVEIGDLPAPSSTSLFDRLMANIAATNSDPNDFIETVGDYVIMGFFASHNANSWLGATTATYTVPGGKSAICVFHYATTLVMRDAANRKARLRDVTNSVSVVHENNDMPYAGFVWNGDLTDPTLSPTIAAGSTARMEIWNVDTDRRAMGAAVILKVT